MAKIELNVKSPSARYLLYWHKFANSGLWGFKNEKLARTTAEDFAKQESMYRVVLVDTEEKTVEVFSATDDMTRSIFEER